MQIDRLTVDYPIKGFDCGDDDLNDFLLNEAKSYHEGRIATTYLCVDNGIVIAYFSLLNDKISKADVSKSAWRKLKKLFPHSKHRSNYPAIKIGRFAVSIDYASQGIGSILMDSIKRTVQRKCIHSAFRFLTVDAYLSAVPFYLKNGFVEMLTEMENEHTRTMYFDMLNVTDE